MTEPAAPRAVGAPARFFLAAVLALGVAFGFATTASATTSAAAQNAVGASTVTSATVVGPSANVSPDTSRENYDSQPKTASATGVAANSAAQDVAVIGRQADTAALNGAPGHEVLNVPAAEWSPAVNDQWVQSVVARNMDVYVGSNPTWSNLWDAANARPTVFGTEVQQFTDAGYAWDGWYLRAPAG